jgi:hypothetical protein
MIRPFTCLAFLLACGSGLYLYQSKHRASLLDEQIAQTAKSTDVLREQTRMLSAEWTLLNDPERLRQLANQFLTLQTVSPNQFTSLADLDSRLPAPVPPGAPVDAGNVVASTQVPGAMASDDAGRSGTDAGKPADAKLAGAKPAEAKIADASTAAAPKDQASPASRGISQLAASPPVGRVAMTGAAEQSHPADGRSAVSRVALVTAQPRSVANLPRPPEQRGAEQRAPESRGPEQRLAETRPMAPLQRLPAPMPMPQAGGSLLGMAHGMAVPPAPMPLPRPMPVSAPNWAYSGSGG